LNLYIYIYGETKSFMKKRDGLVSYHLGLGPPVVWDVAHHTLFLPISNTMYWDQIVCKLFGHYIFPLFYELREM
jgi:hypothetical protein